MKENKKEWKEALRYENGRMADALYNAGPVLADDRFGETAEDCIMQLVTDTDEKAYRAYLEKLEGLGYARIFENHTPAFDSCQLQSDGSLLYVYFTRAAGEVRIVEDRAGVALKDFSYGRGEGDSAQIYQYALYYDPQNGHSPRTTNCGMFYIIRLSDNSLVMIDGGDNLQCSKEAVEGMYAFLRKITNTHEGEKIRIAAWFFTHGHNDHMAACVKLKRSWPGVFEIERVMVNFPHFCVRAADSDIFLLKETLRELCPGIKCLKLHTGQVITLDNVRFEVFYTHEDAVRAEKADCYPLQDYNCSSTVLKMYTGGGSVLWLGDTNVETQELVVEKIPASMWKTDVVQVAHHTFNYLSKLYPLIDADYAMVPNSYYGAHCGENAQKLADVKKCLSAPENIWYEEKTTGFCFRDGSYRVIFEQERVGKEHDGSGLMERV